MQNQPTSSVGRSANAEVGGKVLPIPAKLAAPSLFPDNATAERWFAEQRWQREEFCPHCGSMSIQKGARHKTMPYRCHSCHKRFSVRTGTVMEKSNLSYHTWALAMHSFASLGSALSSMKLHRDLGISYKSAYRLIQRLRQVQQERENPLFDCMNGLMEFAAASQKGNGHPLPMVGVGRCMAGKTRADHDIGWNTCIEDAATDSVGSKLRSWNICMKKRLGGHSRTSD